MDLEGLVEHANKWEASADQVIANPNIETSYMENNEQYGLLYDKFFVRAGKLFDTAAAWYIVAGKPDDAKRVLTKSQELSYKLKKVCENTVAQSGINTEGIVKRFEQERMLNQKLALVSESGEELSGFFARIAEDPLVRDYAGLVVRREQLGTEPKYPPQFIKYIEKQVKASFGEVERFHLLFSEPDALDALRYAALSSKIK